MSGLTLTRRGTIAHVAAVLPPYNIVWAHSAWFGDPLWANPGDGNPIDSIRNSSGGGDPASTGTNRPTFRLVTAAYNNKPTAQFVRASSQRLYFDIANVGQPCSMVVVGNTGGANGLAEVLMGSGQATGGGIQDSAANARLANFGASLVGAASDANPHLFRTFLNGATSAFAVDGTTEATGNVGANSIGAFVLGAGASTVPAFANHLNGNVAFAGIAAGDVTTQTGWAAFKSWVASEYGLTIA